MSVYKKRLKNGVFNSKNKIKKNLTESDEDSIESDSDEISQKDVTHQDNKIYFKTKISEKSIDLLIKIIDLKNKNFRELRNNIAIKFVQPNPLYLHITSYGGDLMSSFRAVDAIKRSLIPIYTVIDGYAASGATLMAAVGKKRYMTPGAYVLIHQLIGVSAGKYWEIKDDFVNCEMWMKDIINLYITHTKLREKELEEYLSHDLWWKFDKCIQLGLIDEVYDGNQTD